MRARHRGLALAAALAAGLAPAWAAGAGALAAQALRPPALRDDSARASMPEPAIDSPRVRSPAIRIGKWLALGAGVGFATYGYRENRLADSRYEDLDRACQFDPVRCLPRTSTGAFTDAGLERQFQDIRRLDRRATFGLVGAELGFAGALALFLLDLRNARREPPNIPYTPPKVEVGTGADGRLELGFRVAAPFGGGGRGR